MTQPVDPPLTWQALQFVAECLQRISVANGFRTEVGASVTTEPQEVKESDTPVVMLAAIGVDLIPEKSAQRMRSETIDLQIDAVVPFSVHEAQRVAHDVMWDLRWALHSPPRSRPEGVTRIEIQRAEFIQRPDGSSVINVQLIARVSLVDRLPPA